jgi:hypothetical protein
MARENQWKRESAITCPSFRATRSNLRPSSSLYFLLLDADHGFKTYSESIITPPTLWPKAFTFENFQTITKLAAAFGFMPVTAWR